MMVLGTIKIALALVWRLFALLLLMCGIIAVVFLALILLTSLWDFFRSRKRK